MSNLADIKEKLLNKAFSDFQEQVEKTDFEKPPEEETFKENQSTAEAVKKQLEYEAEMARVSKIAAQGGYTVSETTSKSSSTPKKTETTETKNTSGWGGYSGYGYGYGTKPTTQTESSEEALKKKAAKEKAGKIIKSAYEESKNNCSSSSSNIFDMAKEAQKEKEIKTMELRNPSEYKKYVAKQKGKVSIARDLLDVVKGILEDINMYRG